MKTTGKCFLARLFLVALILNTIMTVYLQAQVIQEWVRTYNGPGDGGDQVNKIAVSNNGSVYVTGGSEGVGSSFDYATIKYNSTGAEQWIARYNGPGLGIDQATAVILDSSDNVYVTGMSMGSGSNFDYATIRYNSAGVEQWVARYNGPGNLVDQARAIVLDSLGNVYVTGSSEQTSTNPDFCTIKYNNSGSEQWVQRYNSPGSSYDVAKAIALDKLGNVYVTGFATQSGGTNSDFCTIKYNASGAEQWVKLYNGPGNNYDEAISIALDESSSVYVAGRSIGSGTYYDYSTIKYSASGVEQWVQRYNGPGNSWDEPYAIAADRFGNVYVTGKTTGNGTSFDYTTIKYNSAGVQQWVQSYDGSGNLYDAAYAIALDESENVYVTGDSRAVGPSECATIKYDSAGTEQWVQRYHSPANIADASFSIAIDSLTNVYIAGAATLSGLDPDYLTIKYSQQVGIENQDPSAISYFNLQGKPNPFHERLNISCRIGLGGGTAGLKIYDPAGRLVKDFSLPVASAGQGRATHSGASPYGQQSAFITWDGTDGSGKKVPAGVYLLALVVNHAGSAGHILKTEKAVLLR